MGLSGFKGKVYYDDASCLGTSDCELTATGTADTCLADEVTRFQIVDSVLKREYGHDKSGGWQDVVAGIRRLGITIDAVCGSGTFEGTGGDTVIHAGKVLFLELYPFGAIGTCAANPVSGYALVDQVSYTYDQETGRPVSYTATLSSKGPWGGVGGELTGWGGFECACGPGSSGT